MLNPHKKKLTIVQINSVCYGSTGKLMRQMQKEAVSEGNNSYILYGRGSYTPISNEEGYFIKFGKQIDFYFHVLMARLFGLNGRFSKNVTKDLVKKLKEIKPDIIHMHNIHGYYIHLETLFDYLKKSNAKIFWTLHDCWSITGRCAFFEDIECEKWIKGCNKCPRKNIYPVSIIDRSKSEYGLKKRLFTSLSNLTIVTPCYWLSDLVSKSYLRKYPVHVINNGIDLKLFKPVKDIEKINEFKERYGILNKKVILGVANIWEKRKRLDILVSLARFYSEKGMDRVVLAVGLSEKQVKESKKENNFIALKRTKNTDELILIYSIADVFLSASVEETFPLVSLEAMACNTPVVSVKAGGIDEQITEDVGKIIHPRLIKKDSYLLSDSIEEVLKNDYSDSVRKRAETFYGDDLMVERYISLYHL